MNFEPPPLIERLHRAANPQPSFELGYSHPLWTPPKAGEQAKPEAAVVESDADAIDAATLPPVVEPAPRDMQAEVRALLAGVFAYLDRFIVQEDSEDSSFEAGYRNPFDTSIPARPQPSPESLGFETRKTALLSELRKWSESLVEFLSDHRLWTIAALTLQQERAAAEVRTQIAVVKKAVEEHESLVAVFRALRLETSKAHTLLAACEAREPSLDNCPTRIEVARWAQEHSECSAVYEAAQSAEDVARAQLNRLSRMATEEQNKLRALVATEKALRARLSGGETVDQGTGLLRL